jgi:hypothetical protein
MLMEVLEALACIAEIERKIDNLFRHGPATERKRIDGAGSFACASAARRQVALSRRLAFSELTSALGRKPVTQHLVVIQIGKKS